jgi:tRNA pseudouridine55 synthase
MSADGILVVDKPRDQTSRSLTTAVARLFQEKRAGHLGTLDPLATGVLPILLGKATRLARFLEGHDKEYRAIVRLGQETTTWDAAGELVAESSLAGLAPEAVEEAVKSFRGEIEQVPPMHSALKRGGQPLYRLARKGEEVPRPARRVKIQELKVEKVELPEVVLRVVCSPGTYLRSLAHDLGERLGVGGHLAGLRRLRSGGFTLAQAAPGEALTLETAARALIPLRECLPDFPVVAVTPEEERALCQGQAIPGWERELKPGGHYRLVREDLVAIGQAREREGRIWIFPRPVLADRAWQEGRSMLR